MRLFSVAFLSTVMLASGVFSPPMTNETVCGSPVVKASQLDSWNSADCPVADQQIMFPDGRIGALPDPGWTVTASSITKVGYPVIPDVTVSRGLDGDVAV